MGVHCIAAWLIPLVERRKVFVRANARVIMLGRIKEAVAPLIGTDNGCAGATSRSMRGFDWFVVNAIGVCVATSVKEKDHIPTQQWAASKTSQRITKTLLSLCVGPRGYCSISLLQELCSGFEVLEETLVLRVEKGAEYYIPVFGSYASPAFGTPLEQLSANHGSQVTSKAHPRCRFPASVQVARRFRLRLR